MLHQDRQLLSDLAEYLVFFWDKPLDSHVIILLRLAGVLRYLKTGSDAK